MVGVCLAIVTAAAAVSSREMPEGHQGEAETEVARELNGSRGYTYTGMDHGHGLGTDRVGFIRGPTKNN